jgi:predicted RecA/RadA family phage recombinase
VTNPPTLVETSSYKITTLDQSFAVIDFIDTGITLTMTNPATFKSAELVLDSYQNTERTKYTFTVVASAPITAGNVFLVTIPPETKLP